MIARESGRKRIRINSTGGEEIRYEWGGEVYRKIQILKKELGYLNFKKEME